MIDVMTERLLPLIEVPSAVPTRPGRSTSRRLREGVDGVVLETVRVGGRLIHQPRGGGPVPRAAETAAWVVLPGGTARPGDSGDTTLRGSVARSALSGKAG